MRHLICIACYLLCSAASAQEVVIRAPSGEYEVIDVEPEMSCNCALAFLQYLFNSDGEFVIDFMSCKPKQTAQAKSAKAIVREYWNPITKSEKEDIAFIINTLGMGSLIKINNSKSAIKKAGKRIDHVHPFRFLMCIFTDDEMIASIHAMDGRTFVWSEFKSGTVGTLEAEATKDNLKPEFIEHFASEVGVGAAPIHGFVASRQWDNLISYLIANVKRNADAGRYNMMIP